MVIGAANTKGEPLTTHPPRGRGLYKHPVLPRCSLWRIPITANYLGAHSFL